MASKDFSTVDVLSTISGRLVGHIDGVYEVLNWMTGESLFTHQLPRVAKEARPVLLKAHPELQAAIDEAEQVNRENYEHWRDAWVERYGDTIAVPQFSEGEHKHVGPLAEMLENVPPERVLVVKA